MEHEAVLGFLGGSAFLVLAIFFGIGGLIVFRVLGDTPGPTEPTAEPEQPRSDQ